MSRRMQLDRLYVQVRVQEQEPPRFLLEEELGRSRRDEAGCESSALDAATAQTYAPVDALQRYHRIVVVGDPGAGKTTMLRHLALCMAEQTSGQGLPELPAYVELFRFVKSGHASLLDYLAEHWESQYGFADARAYVEEQLVTGQAALLLDGLDEVMGGGSAKEALDAYHRVTEEVARLANRFPRALIATTCRRHGWRGGLTQFQVLEALDFEWPQIETFVANWFGDDDRRSDSLVRALSANARLQTLATNPLLLSLIAIVYERDLELPERRAALYRRCVEVLLREWDAHRNIARYSRFTTDRKQDLLKQIARHYHERGQRYFPEDDLLDLIADYLPTIDLPRTDNRDILHEIAAHYGLLKVQAHGWYGFLHLTLQEHFAATALLEEGVHGVDRAVAARYEPWWEEVILLLAGSLPDASPLLLGVLQLVPGPRRTRPSTSGRREILDLPGDDLFHSDLLLAVRCLTGSPRVADVELRQQIINTTWELLETSPYAEERRRTAEAIVSVLGSERHMRDIIAYIGDGSRNEAVQAALVDALAMHGGHGVGDRLVGLHALLSRSERRQLTVSRHVITAFGTLRLEAAVPVLLAELAEAIAAISAHRKPSYEIVVRVSTVVRALGAVGGPMQSVLDAMEHARDAGRHQDELITAGVAALRDSGDATALEDLQRLLVIDCDWFFERLQLAAAYLSLSGEQGVGVLLNIVQSDGIPDDHRLPIVAALADNFSEVHGRYCRASLLDLAADESTPWQIRWFALECLDHTPGTEGEIAALLDSSNAYVSTGAAATLAAWGAPTGLDLIHREIMSGSVSASLSYKAHLGHAYSWRGRIARRLAKAITPYGVSGMVQHLRALAETSHREQRDAYEWLAVLDSEAWVDSILRRYSSRAVRDLLLYSHLSIPKSRVNAVLGAVASDFGARPQKSQPVADRRKRRLLGKAAAVADDIKSLEIILSMIAHGDEMAEEAHSAAYTVSRRARVRVLRDHRIEPLP